MERCELSLRQALESLPELNENMLVPFVRGMLQALEVIHDARVVHCDIKPDNFLCSGDNMTVKLCDFGLAKIMPSANCSSLSGVFGTAPYMSPEMIANRGYGATTDVWSIGVFVHVMIFGRFPYEPERHNHKAMKQAILSGVPEPSYKMPKAVNKKAQKPDVSKDVISFMRELLERNPVSRPSAKQALHMLWISSPETAETRSARCLQQTFEAAKKIGAFHPKAQAQADDQPDGFDVMLSRLQAKYVSRQNSKDTLSTKASSRLNSKATVSSAMSRHTSQETVLTLAASRHTSKETDSTSASSPMSSREFSDKVNDSPVTLIFGQPTKLPRQVSTAIGSSGWSQMTTSHPSNSYRQASKGRRTATP